MSDQEINSCPNCEQPYDQDFQFCPHCGQKNESSVLTFKEIFSDLLGSFFSFDSKALNSLPKLLFRPGKLTNDYLNGKRASNLSPFRMYLFFSVILFLLLPMIVNEDHLFSANQNVNIDQSGNVNLLVDEVMADLTEEAKQEKTGIINIGIDDSSSLSLWNQGLELLDSLYTPKEIADSLLGDKSKMVRFLFGQGVKLYSKRGSGLVGVFLNSVSYSLFLFLPLFALILKLLYVRRKRLYIEHFIFALHLFSFVFVILIVLTSLAIWKVKPPPMIAISILLLYLYFALINTYQQGFIKTLFKNASLLFMTILFLFPLVLVIASIVSLIFY